MALKIVCHFALNQNIDGVSTDHKRKNEGWLSKLVDTRHNPLKKLSNFSVISWWIAENERFGHVLPKLCTLSIIYVYIFSLEDKNMFTKFNSSVSMSHNQFSKYNFCSSFFFLSFFILRCRVLPSMSSCLCIHYVVVITANIE